MKKCTKCGLVKMLTEFGLSKAYKDGHRAQCKECIRIRDKLWESKNPELKLKTRKKYREKNREHIREMDREYYKDNHDKRLETARKAQMKYFQTEKGREKYDRIGKEQRKKFPEKCRARSLLSNAICDGKIVKPKNCSLCGTDQFMITAHHPDYSKPYDVIWLCRPCHGFVHRKIKSHRERLSEKTVKTDAKVQTIVESNGGEFEAVLPPSKDGQKA